VFCSFSFSSTTSLPHSYLLLSLSLISSQCIEFPHGFSPATLRRQETPQSATLRRLSSQTRQGQENVELRETEYEVQVHHVALT